MPEVSTTPATPISGKTCKVTPTATNTGTAIRVWCTAAPPGSTLRKKLDASGSPRVAIGTFEAGKPFDFTPEKGGAYQLTLDELRRGTFPNTEFRGAYDGDTRGAPNESIIVSDTDSIFVAEAYELELGIAPDKATLRVYVVDQFLIETTAAIHGVVTPAIVSTTSARAKAAAETPAIRAAIRALGAPTMVDGEPVYPVASALTGGTATSGRNMSDIVSLMAKKFGRHLHSSGVHLSDDADNVTPEYLTAESQAIQSEALGKLLSALDRHVRNANPTAETNPGETGSADPAYHKKIGAALPMPGARPGQTPASVWLAASEFWRTFSAHILDDDAHVNGDAANALGELLPLMDLHVKFLTELASTEPTAPPTANSAGRYLVQAGFHEAS